MSHKSGNSIIPTDKQYDEYYAIRCEDCLTKLTTSEIDNGPPYLCETCIEKADDSD